MYIQPQTDISSTAAHRHTQTQRVVRSWSNERLRCAEAAPHLQSPPGKPCSRVTVWSHASLSSLFTSKAPQTIRSHARIAADFLFPTARLHRVLVVYASPLITLLLWQYILLFCPVRSERTQHHAVPNPLHGTHTSVLQQACVLVQGMRPRTKKKKKQTPQATFQVNFLFSHHLPSLVPALVSEAT